jgi:hypothetical protein
MKIQARYIFTMCTIFRLFFTRHETVRSHFRKRKNFWSMRSRIITFCLKISIFIIFLKWFVEIDTICNNEWVFKHNKKTRFDINVIQEIYHAKKSHNNKHHRFHVYDNSFDRQIKTLHDEIWFKLIIESHIDLDLHILRNRVELISNLSKNVKIDRFEKDQKS